MDVPPGWCAAYVDALAALHSVGHAPCALPLDVLGRLYADAACAHDHVPLGAARRTMRENA